MTKVNLALGLAVVAVVLAIIQFYQPAQKALFGSSVLCNGTSNTTCLTGNLRLNDGAFQMGSSTSCIMVNATSTATTIEFNFTTVGATSTYNGTVYWTYGTCA